LRAFNQILLELDAKILGSPRCSTQPAGHTVDFAALNEYQSAPQRSENAKAIARGPDLIRADSCVGTGSIFAVRARNPRSKGNIVGKRHQEAAQEDAQAQEAEASAARTA
jgi:hypothetical protein